MRVTVKDRVGLGLGLRKVRVSVRTPMFAIALLKLCSINMYNLLLICDAIHNAMTSQQCNTNTHCMVVLHACIHEPLVRSQPALERIKNTYCMGKRPVSIFINEDGVESAIALIVFHIPNLRKTSHA